MDAAIWGWEISKCGIPQLAPPLACEATWIFFAVFADELAVAQMLVGDRTAFLRPRKTFR